MPLDAVLLAPLSDASPCGEDLSFSADFDAIQELRRADDPTLDPGEWVTALKTADWPGVLARCTDLLAHRSKDLRVAAWWTDAAARLDGFAGLADGLTLCARLAERFWDDLHPRPDDDGDAEQRAGSLRWLLAQVETLAPQLPLLRVGGRTLALRDLRQAQAPSRAGGTVGAHDDEASAVSSADAVTADTVAEARRQTPAAFLAANDAAAQRARDALADLERTVDARLGEASPGFAGARQALDDAAHAAGRLALEAGAGVPGAPGAPPAPGDVVAPQGATATDAAAPDAALLPTGPLRTRAEALQQLRAVAAFFRRTEPHSPVAYLAERAAQWGEMPLHAWLRAVVKDGTTLAQMEELLGIEPPAAA